jgi:hypothetical protein
VNNPTILGQFPATALMFRRGDVTQPDKPAVRETISLADACGPSLGGRKHDTTFPSSRHIELSFC